MEAPPILLSQALNLVLISVGALAVGLLWLVLRTQRRTVPQAASHSEVFRALSGLQLAIIVTDVQNSTKLWESHPVLMRHALGLHDALLRSEMARHGGYELLTEGDSFQVLYVTPCD